MININTEAQLLDLINYFEWLSIFFKTTPNKINVEEICLQN